MRKPGVWVISLDFELHWGVRDSRSLESYRKNLLAVRQVVPELLERFSRNSVHVTWATVGFLFARDKAELLASAPLLRPSYSEKKFNPYSEWDRVGQNEAEDPFHFAWDLIEKIHHTPGQELATHTYSHYYCLEAGQQPEQFRADLEAARSIGRSHGLEMESIVFPRNQFNADYLEICREKGIQAYRGNESSWIYRPLSRESESLLRRGLRLLDAYLNLSGQHLYSWEELAGSGPRDIPSSRFLRPYSPRLKALEPLRFRRMSRAMTKAAQEGKVFHLWWHPHNFGANMEENLEMLDRLISHFVTLRADYGMTSLTMGELAKRLNEE